MTSHIFAVLADHRGARSCLEAAFAAATAVDTAPVVALHFRVDPRTTILPTEEMLTDLRRREVEGREDEERRAVHTAFTAVAGDLGPSAFRWVDGYGTEKKGVATHTQDAALIVMAVPERHHAGHAQEAMHAALFDAGRPLLLVPRDYRPRPVERVVVAWHDDAPCRRAIDGALPWLRRAVEVRVVAVGGGGEAVLDPARGQMRDLGVHAAFAALDRGGSSKGDCLLAAARGADWLVMGARRRGEFIDMLIGSTTDVVIAGLTLPVLFAH